MALIKCPECGENVSDKSKICIHCGYPLQKEIQYCPYCGKGNLEEDTLCKFCGKSLQKSDKTNELTKTSCTSLKDFKEELDSPNDIVEIQKEQLNQQKQQYEAQAKCPRCGSVSLACNKKGYGVGKALAGALVFGGIGLLAGGIGANKNIITCLKCGHKFKI